MSRLFFAVDVHGASSVWRKWLKIPEMYDVQALLLCGDLTGKSLVPIIKKENGKYNAFYFGKNWTLETEQEIENIKNRIHDAGAYTLKCDMDKVRELQDDPGKVDKIMLEEMKKRLHHWLDLLINKIDLDKVDVVVMPGNDDDWEMDKVIKSYQDQGVVWALGEVIDVLGIPTISLDYVNPTPWDTPREDSEKGMAKRIEKIVAELKNPSQSIFNFHAPPYGTMLDLAPELDANRKPVTIAGQVNFVHVGSKAVTKALEKYQPLIGLHGHIHESYGNDKVGQTPVVNPGSEYGEGILRGYIVEVNQGEIENYWKVEG